MIFTTKNNQLAIFGKTLDDVRQKMISFHEVWMSGGRFGSNKSQIIPEANLTKVLSFDEASKQLNDFNRHVVQGGMSLDTYFKKYQNGNTVLKNYVTTTEQQNQSTQGLIKASQDARNAQIAHNESIKAGTLSAKAASVALKALSIAGNMLVFMAISKAISSVVQKFDNWIHRTEKAKEAADELASTLKSATDSLKSQKDLIDRVEESCDRLSDGVDRLGNNVSLSKEDFAAYQDICNEIAEYYPEMVTAWTNEGNAVVDLKNKVNDLKTAYEEERIAALNSFVADADDVIDSYNLNADYSSSNGLDKTSGYKQQIAALQAYLDILTNVDKSEQTNAINDMMKNGGKGFSGHDLQNALKDLELSKYELDQIPAYLGSVIKNLQTKLSQEDNSMKQMLLNMFSLDSNDYDSLSDEAYQLGTAFINSLDSGFFDDKNTGDYREFIDNLLDQLTGDNADKVKLAFDSLVDLDKTKESLTASEFKDYANDIIADLQNYLDMDEDTASLIVNTKLAESNIEITDVDTMVNNVKKKLKFEFEDKVGELTLDELQIATEQVEVPDGTLLSWDELIAKIKEVQSLSSTPETPELSITDTITKLNSIKEKFDVLDKTYAKLFDKDTDIGFEDFSAISEAFSDLDNIDDYISLLQEAGQDTEDIQAAISRIAGVYLDYSGILDSVNEQNAELIAQTLSELGIENAHTLVMQQLAASKELAALKTFDLADATAQEILALADEGAVSDEISEYILKYALRKELANGTTLTTDGDIENIRALVEELGGATDALLRFQTAKNGTAIEMKNPNDKKIHTGNNKIYLEGQYAGTSYKKDAQEEIDSVLNSTGGKTNSYGGGSASRKANSSGKSGSGSKSAEQETKETYNWIDRLLETLSEKTKRIADAFSKAFSIGSAQEKYAEYLAQIENEINANSQAIAAYQQKLDSIGLSYEWIMKIQSGAFSIEDVTDETLRDQIAEYQKWYDKIEECYDSIRSLEEERLKAQAEYADKVIESHDREIQSIQRVIDRHAAFSDLRKSFVGFASADKLNVQLDRTALQIDTIEKQNRALNELILTTEYGSEAWQTYNERIEDNQKTLLDLAQNLADLAEQLANLPIEKYEAFIKKVDARKELYDAKLENSHSYSRQERILDRQMGFTAKSNSKAQQTADRTERNLSSAVKGFSSAKEKDLQNAAPGQEASVNSYYDDIRKYIKAGKVIPATIVARLSEAGHGALAEAAVRYNAALAADETAQATAKLMAQTTQRELAEAARRKAEIPASRYSDYLERNETKDTLYGAKLENATSAKKQNSIINKQMSIVSKNNAKAQQTAEDTAENLASSKTSLRSAGKTDAKGKSRKQKKELDSLYKKVQNYVKSKKEIPSSVLTKLAEGNFSALYQAAVNYNAALAADETAQETATLSAETAKKELAQLAQAKFENIQSEYERKQGVISSKAGVLSAKMDLSTEKGLLSSRNWYSKLTEYEKSNNRSLAKELEKLKDELDTSMENGDIVKYSDEWWEMTDSINATTEALAESDVTLQKYINSLRQVEFDTFDYTQGQISRLTSEADFYIDSMTNLRLKDDGGLTDHGITAAGLHYQNYDTYLKQAEDYAEEIRRINAMLAENPYDTNLVSQMQEYQDAQRECIKNAEDEKRAVADLVKEGYESLIEALRKSINKYKELIQNAKNAHDYQNTISEQSGNIASLRKQLAAYSGMTGSEETAAKIQTLNRQLADAEKDMEETMYDRYISDTQDALDGMLNELEEFINELYNNIDELFRDGVGQITASVDTIYATLGELSGSYGTTLSDSIRTVWNENYYNPEQGFALILGRMDALIAASDAQAARDSAGIQAAQEQTSSTPAPVKETQKAELVSPAGENTKERETKNVTGTLLSAASQKKQAEAFIKANVKKPAKAYADYSDVNRAIWKNKAGIYSGSGKALTLEDMKELAGILGVKYNNASKTGNLYKKLKELGIKGYAKGSRSIPHDQMALTQEEGTEVILSDGSMLVPLGQGDMVFTNEMSKRLYEISQTHTPEELRAMLGIDTMPVIPSPVDTMGSMPVNVDESRNIGNVEINFGDVNLPDVTNPEEFAEKFCHMFGNSTRAQKMVRTYMNNYSTSGRTMEFMKYIKR